MITTITKIMNEKHLVKEIKQVDWQHLITRQHETLLFFSLTDGGTAYKNFIKTTGIPWQPHYMMRYNGNLYHSARELNQLKKTLAMGGVKVFLDFCSRLIKNINALNKLSLAIEKKDYSLVSQNKLLQGLEEFFQTALKSHNFLLPLPVADGVLTNMIIDNFPEVPSYKKQEWLFALTYPTKENEHTKEERDFYKLAQAYLKKSKNFDKILSNHLKKYSWIGARGYQLNIGWTKSELMERLKSFVAENKSPLEKIKILNNARKKSLINEEKLIKKLAIKKNSLLYRLISLAREFAYLRTWRTDVCYGAGYRARNLFFEAARRAKINCSDVTFLTYPEILDMAKHNKLPIEIKELKKRKEFFVFVTLNSKTHTLVGKEWDRKLHYLVSENQHMKKEIKGNIAFPGKVKGVVRLVLNHEDIQKIERGDIMVSVMTFPHFVPAMEKAAAFITDEGGILCHAAIVAREMQKPCVINTKIATKVLKDGDIIEVDADKGIVRRIK